MTFRMWIRYLRKAFELWQIVSHEYGWKKSFLERRPVDGKGCAIPWYTYPAIEFLRSLDLHDRRVFEFGCGNSSVFWAERVSEVVAVENDIEWAKTVRAYGIKNISVLEEPAQERYTSAPERVDGKFDIVVIDGRFRRECIASAVRVIKMTGFIIFDNADWYPDACEDLRSRGWFQIDFSGPGPINPYCWTTSVFLSTSSDFRRLSDASPAGGIRQNASSQIPV